MMAVNLFLNGQRPSAAALGFLIQKITALMLILRQESLVFLSLLIQFIDKELNIKRSFVEQPRPYQEEYISVNRFQLALRSTGGIP